jgi:catechol 2,3-dioxygenase-like lactoylglutathione lyase family enzyme
MTLSIASVTLVVRNYDEAISFFTQALNFELLEDTPLGNGKRWVVVRPRDGNGASLLLAQGATPEQASRVGNQTGGRVSFFLYTDDFWRDFREMQSQGIEFLEQPREESYGTAVVFVDLYGNKWDLLQLKPEQGRHD